MTSEALRFHALGLFFIGQGRVVTQAFFAYKDLKTPMYVSFGDALVNVGLCYLLAGPLGHAGIALASTLAALGYSLVLQWFLYRRIGGGPSREVLLHTARIGVATGALVLVLVVASTLVDTDTLSRPLLLLWLAGALGLAGVAFYTTASLLKVNELNELLASLKRRFRRR